VVDLDPDRHRCAFGRRCRDHDGMLGAVIADERGFCKRCFGMVRAAIRELAGDWNRLCAAVGDHGTSGEVHVSGTREPLMPLNGTVLALRSTLSEWSEAALWMVAEPLGIDVRERHKARGWPVKDGPVVQQAARVLPENIKALLGAPEQAVSVWNKGSSRWGQMDLDGIGVAMRLADIHHEVNSVLGLTNLRQRSSMPCPNFECGARGTLGINNGSDVVDCTACGRQWSRGEYDWLLNLLIDEEQAKEVAMLKFLLAEAQWWCDVLAWCIAERDSATQWLIAERDHKLFQIGRLARMSETDLAGIDGFAVVELVREML
jgi:hypothetical protein